MIIEKQYVKYLKVLIFIQILTGVLMIGILCALAGSLSKNSSEALRSLAISESHKSMKKIVDDIIIRIDLKRELVQQQFQSEFDIIATMTQNQTLPLKTIQSIIDAGRFSNVIQVFSQTKDAQWVSSTNNATYSQEEIEDLFTANPYYRFISGKDATFLLLIDSDDLEKIVQNYVKIEIYNSGFPQDEYVWVNEVVNYEGGEDYAKRIIHPNLPYTEGHYLSTNYRDLKGNRPYNEELQGILETGEAFHSYFFVRRSDGKISEKFSYAKLYEPYNWVIATGIPLQDALYNAEELVGKNLLTLETAILFAVLSATFFFACGILLFVRLQRKYQQQVENFVSTETELDILTGAQTRKSGEKSLTSSFKLFQQGGKSPLICMMDIDNFKGVNDHYGHDIGDLVLKKLSDAILKSIGPNDNLIRWGGEEFILIIRDIALEDEELFSKNILEKIRQLTFDGQGVPFHTTISMSGSFFLPEDNSYNQAVKRADLGLYHVKRNGKNHYYHP